MRVCQFCRPFQLLTCFLCYLLVFVRANKEKINQNDYQVCAGMYSKEDWRGKKDPFISFNLKKISGMSDDSDPGIVVAIYDFQDFEHLGAELPDGEMYYICDGYAIDIGICEEENRDEFIIQDVVYDPYTSTNKSLANPIMTFPQSEVGLHDTRYPIKETGFYCVTAFRSSSSTKFNAVVNFRNAYGHLAGTEINKLPLYGLLAVAYVVAMALYSFAFWKHKHELLPLQKYLLAFFVFLTAETIFVWAYYDLKNEKGNTAGIKVYMVFLSILTAGKVTFSFFLLLIIALGYGIVYPKLNKTLMRRCQVYAALTYAICIGFLIQSYLTDMQAPSPLILITLIPMALALIVFYYMIIRSMTKTVIYLKEQRQIVKLNMYKKLLYIIYASFLSVLAGSIVSSFIYVGMNTIEMIEKNWRSRFFVTDFWPTLVYFIVFVTIAFLWRPTDTSYMLAASQQLPTDPENVADFDLGDLQSFDDQDDASIITGERAIDEDDLNLNFTDEEEGHDNVNNHGHNHEPLPSSPTK